MIYTVTNRYSRQHVGIVNEPNREAATIAARETFGNRWFKDNFLSPEALDVELGDTQHGMEPA